MTKQKLEKKVQNNNLTIFALIAAVTILGLTALIINSEGQFDSTWGEGGGSLHIKGKQMPKINDCLSSEESSHYLNCNNQ